MIGVPSEGGKAGRDADRWWLLALLAVMLAVSVAELRRRAARPGAPAGAGAVLHRVDLSTADAAELQLLPGIGPRLAERIVDARAAGGAFRSVEDCARRVPGIGPARVRSWRGRVVEPDGRVPDDRGPEEGER